jgi:hypothetical protein
MRRESKVVPGSKSAKKLFAAPITEADKPRIKELYPIGFSYQEIADDLVHSDSRDVSDAIQEMIKNGELQPRKWQCN